MHRLSASDQETAARFKQRLTAFCPVRQILVFGSRARGDATWESDLDVLVVLDTTAGDDPVLQRRIAEVAWEVGFAAGLVIAPVVVTQHALEHSPLAESPLLRQIYAEGVAV